VIKHLEGKSMASVQIKSEKQEVVEAIEAFKTIAKDSKQDLGSLLISMISAYNASQQTQDSDLNFNLGYSDKEQEEIENALSQGHSSFDLMRVGYLAQCRKVKSQSEKLEVLKEKIENASDDVKTTLKGSADLRIDRAVKAVLAHNDSQSDIDNQWFVTATAIQKMTKCNMPAIKAYLIRNQSEIDSHHTKHGLTGDTNRFRKGRSMVEEVVI